MDIHTALQLHSENEINQFLRTKNVNVNIRDICDQTPLHIASAQGMCDVMKKLIKKKADMNSKDSKGWTPLHCAANEQQYDACTLLINSKADITAITEDQASVFAYAVKGRKDPLKQVELLQLMLSKQPSLLDQYNFRKETPLCRACIAGSFEVIQLLLKNKASVNTQTIEGISCLHNAVRSGRKDVVKLLLDNKANPLLKNCDNLTAQEEANAFGDKYMAEYLEETLEANINLPPVMRRTIVSELVNVFNKSYVDNEPPSKRLSQHAVPLIPKKIVIEDTSENDEIERPKSKQLSGKGSEDGDHFLALKLETELLLDLLEKGNINLLSNSKDVANQILEVKKLLEVKKARNRSSTLKTLKDKFSSTGQKSSLSNSEMKAKKGPPVPPRRIFSAKSLDSDSQLHADTDIKNAIDDVPLTIEAFFEIKNQYFDKIKLPSLYSTENRVYPANIRARQMTFGEILSTESLYIRQLACIIAYYLRPLQNEMSHLIDSEDLKTIFFNFESIFEISMRLYSRLLEEEKKEPSKQEIGKIFLSFKKDFSAYSPYCTSQVTAIETLEKLRSDNKLLDSFLYNTYKGDNPIAEDLNGYLIKPFQRICRYALLLKELKKQTPSSWDDYSFIESAIESTSYIVRKANETQRLVDNLEKIQLIQSKLDVDLDIKRAVQFILEGDVKELDSRKNIQKRHFFLFSNLIVICKAARGGKWQCKYNIPVRSCILWNIPDSEAHKNCFQIVRTDSTEKIIFECKSEEEKEEYMSAINGTISPNGEGLLHM